MEEQMHIKYRVRQSFLKIRVASTKNPFFKMKTFSAAILVLMLAVNVLPATDVSAPLNVYGGPDLQTTSTLTFAAEADARVHKSNPNSNYGTSTYLYVAGASDPDIESFIRFTVSGVAGTVQSVQLRVYTTTNSSTNGPAVYGGDNTWTETGITWNNRPARTSDVVDNKGAINTNTWIEYNVSPLVTGNGTHTFVLVADSSDGIRFSSREGSQPPQLVLTFASDTNTPTVTRTLTYTSTATQPVGFTSTSTPTPLPGTTITATSTPAATTTPGLGNTLTFTTVADARVVQASPTTNYGTSTTLQVDGDTVQTSYIRFSVTGISGSIQSVKLRVFCTTNGTVNGPVTYLANSNWIESGSGGITWNTRPALLSGALDNRGAIGTNSWVEYDVTALVTGNGTFTFALVADSNDGVTFSSREGTADPQLVITLGTGAPTASAMPSQTRTATPTVSRTPTPGSTSSGSVVLVGAGDITSCSRNQDELTAQLLDNITGTVFTTGDNAYIDGSYSDYINCYDPTWGRHKSRTKPTPGNHDYQTSGAAGYFQYFNNIASYYAYNLGSWRIYALNSEISVSATSAQVTWLEDDLAANPSQCVLAYWHKPRWSSGANHGNNSSMQTLWQVLYNAGAELVINGHEHHYERFAEMNASGSAVSQGLREIVVGTGGATLYPFGTPLSASQVRNSSTYGVLKLTLRATGYDWQFVPVAGSTFTDGGSDSCR